MDKPKARPADVGALLDAYRAGRHADVFAAFEGLAPADAAGLAGTMIEMAADRVVLVDGGSQLEAARTAFDLCRYFRRWQS